MNRSWSDLAARACVHELFIHIDTLLHAAARRSKEDFDLECEHDC